MILRHYIVEVLMRRTASTSMKASAIPLRIPGPMVHAPHPSHDTQ